MVGKLSHPSSCAQLEFYFNILIFTYHQNERTFVRDACQGKGEIFVISGSNIPQVKKSCSLQTYQYMCPLLPYPG